VRKFSKRKIAATIAITAILVGGGGAAAIAYWSTSGSGTGTAVTGTSTGITVNQATAATNITPGGATQALSGTFTNTNSGPVNITTVTATVTSVTPGSGTPAGTCVIGDYKVTGTATLGTASVPVGTNVDTWSGLTLSLNNTTANQDACKGVTVNLTYTAS
jgi:hypothetical protein